MSLPIFHVDAFTDKPFAGNPAAVCLLTTWPEPTWLQAVAAEMNLSETAFLVKTNKSFALRWFTPTQEVDLCGHATLASAHVLWSQRLVKPDTVLQFATKSGTLTATNLGSHIELDLPFKPIEAVTAPPGLEEALNLQPKFVGRNQFDYLLELDSAAELRTLQPDFRRLATLPARGICVTCRSDDPQFDFLSRFFAPATGINEDPVTGSAHCYLADYWRPRLGKSEFLAYQVSARGGQVRVRVAVDRAFLGGQAVIVTKGELGV